MIYTREEVSVNYGEYLFGYANWGIPKSENDIEKLYEQGYLPYSGNAKKLPVYYLCRSLRLDSSRFELSSENRRVIRKITEAGIVPIKKEVTVAEVLENEPIINFFIEYFREHHGDSVMSRDRLVSILNYSPHVKVTVFYHEEIILGAVILQEINNTVHYWFSAYSSNYLDIPLGMWLMISFIQDHTAESGNTIYLGTGYGTKALYKTNIEQIEYFDGNSWIKDVKKLKELMKRDSN